MILHVYEAAYKSKSGEVYVATPDKEILEIVKKFRRKSYKTSADHQTGTDRIFEVFKTLKKNRNIIINLQGDMPNIEPKAITDLVSYMNKEQCDIGTLASTFNSKKEENPNVVKVALKEKISPNVFQMPLIFSGLILIRLTRYIIILVFMPLLIKH